MSAPVTCRDLDRDELLELIEPRFFMFDYRDVLRARWKVAQNREQVAFEAYLEASQAMADAAVASARKLTSKSLAAHEEGVRKSNRAYAKYKRLEKVANTLFEQLSAARP